MHGFVYRLVERLTGDGPRLSRNRHFHTFVTPEGRQALRIARHLRAVARDIARSQEPVRISREAERVRVEVAVGQGLRTAWLTPTEFELLQRIPAVRESLSR